MSDFLGWLALGGPFEAFEFARRQRCAAHCSSATDTNPSVRLEIHRHELFPQLHLPTFRGHFQISQQGERASALLEQAENAEWQTGLLSLPDIRKIEQSQMGV
jgi:hypothetical protein